MNAIFYLICILVGYLIGTINPSYIIARIRGFDIRKKGSENAGASNAVITMGKKTGIPCAIFDILKATAVVLVMGKIFPSLSYNFAVTSTSCILGHIFPFYMGFKGGKGLACLGGVVLAYRPLLFISLLAVEIVIALATKYICFVTITGSVIFAVSYGILERDLISALILGVAAAVILAKHVKNIKRIFLGTEARFSMLWNRQKEMDRLTRGEQ